MLKMLLTPSWRRHVRPADMWAFLAGAIALQPSQYHALNDADDEIGIEPSPGICRIHIPAPDEVYHKRTSLAALSEEAREVVLLVLATPDEAVREICTPKQKKISRPRIREYLLGQGWTPAKVQQAFDELTQYVDALEG